VQGQVIPLLMDGRDVIARSDTGTGKTLAYLIPIFLKIDAASNNLQAVILTPTRELAAQVNDEAATLARLAEVNVRTAAVLGGVNVNRQIEALKIKPHIIVGQATRILELIDRKKLSAHYCKFIVVDEADKTLDKSGESEVLTLTRRTQKDRQTALFSASIPAKTVAAAQRLARDPIIVNADKTTIPKNISHYHVKSTQRDKIKAVRHILHVHGGKALIFVNNPYTIGDVASRLLHHNIPNKPLHGALSGQERREAVQAFKSGAVRVLVSSDVAARGLDITGLTLIINLDAPESPRDYQHRAGRAGRAGEPSLVVTLATDYESHFISLYEKAFDIKIPTGDYK
jgi:superfamily II DNA/RNA helicase